jgi:hypothetical protein
MELLWVDVSIIDYQSNLCNMHYKQVLFMLGIMSLFSDNLGYLIYNLISILDQYLF